MSPTGSLRFELRSAGVSFDGKRALARVDLSIQRGEIVAVVGPSGAGKTTLLRLLNATLLPSEGSVWIDGVNLAGLGPRQLRRLRCDVGFVHQEPSLVPNLRVSHNVIAGKLGRRGLFASIRSIVHPTAGDLAEAYDLLERVGVPEKLFQRTDTLSGGERQRIALARALFQEPSALLADEPIASVDPARGRDLIRLLLGVAEERGLTLVASLHDLAVARAFFPRMVGLRGGRLVFDDASENIDEDSFAELYRLKGARGDG